MSTWKFWAAFSVGVAAGALVALICAPQSGEETRKQIGEKLGDAGDYIKDTAGDLSEKATKVYKRGKEAAADYSDDLVEKVQSTVKGVKASA